jgi:glycosyltransferase involved in cell wall biosynthesis
MVSKKVLIISYFFPPCNLTASQRAYNWGKYFKEFGYDPIIITRKWDYPINTPSDMGKSSRSMNIEEEVNDQYRVYYMPYKGSLKDRIFEKNKKGKKLIRKALSFKELYSQHSSISVLPYANIFNKASQLIKEENIENVIITGNPFACFHFGYELKNKFPAINWIADYRDDWTTTELVNRNSGLDGILFKMEQKSERKWLSNAAFFTTVSDYYVKKISKLTGLQGFKLINGFGEELKHFTSTQLDKSRFEITYNGSLYASQKIEPVLSVAKTLINKFIDQIHIHLNFPGLRFDEVQAQRVEVILKGYEEHYTITGRIPREDVIKIQQKSHILLMIAHEGLKGIPSSKLYEYIGLKKPVLLYPNDNDIIEKTLKHTELGVICDSQEEIENKLTSLVNDFINSGVLPIEGNIDHIREYTRRNQVRKLAQLLDKI